MPNGKKIDKQRMLDIGRRWVEAQDDGADRTQFASAMGVGITTVVRAAALWRAESSAGASSAGATVDLTNDAVRA